MKAGAVSALRRKRALRNGVLAHVCRCGASLGARMSNTLKTAADDRWPAGRNSFADGGSHRILSGRHEEIKSSGTRASRAGGTRRGPKFLLALFPFSRGRSNPGGQNGSSRNERGECELRSNAVRRAGGFRLADFQRIQRKNPRDCDHVYRCKKGNARGTHALRRVPAMDHGTRAGLVKGSVGQSSLLTLIRRGGRTRFMSRALRIQYPGAVYHVMNRGDQREPIFRCDFDHKKFLSSED